MGVLIASVNARLEITFIRKLVDWFILLVTFLSVTSILYYGNGFSISATYLIPAKNQIGPMISIAILLSLFTLINRDFLIKDRKNNFFYLVCFLLTFTSLLTIRNRSGMLAIAFCVFLYCLTRIKFKYKLKTWGAIYFTFCIFLGLFYFGYFDRLLNYIWDSFTLNYDVTNIDMLSAGRFDTYIEGIIFVYENPVFGEIGNNNFLRGTPHNYIIANIVSYGLVFGMPLIVFYLYLWWFTIKNTLFGSKNSMQLEFIWVLFTTLIVSLFEYSYPYGPGTSQLMMWTLFGYFLRSKNIEKKNKSVL
ncbi:O-antigen ligase family protein [Aerococcus viridans]